MHYLLVLLLVLFVPLSWAETVIVDETCNHKYGAKLVSLQGTLLVDPNRKGLWQHARLNQMICEGSWVKVDPNSRASLRLSNGIILRLHEGTVASLDAISPEQATFLNLLKGFIHFISRTPKLLKISTPIANAGPEGTEFAMSVDDDSASLWVYEGGVKFFNDKGSVHLRPGQGAQAMLGQAPQAKIDIKPQDAVNWALYYPPVLPYPDATDVIDSGIRQAIQDYRQGHVDVALIQLDAVAAGQQSPYFHKVRGAMRLSAGQDKLALQDIQALLATNANDAEALALKSVLALTQNRKDEAYSLATQAITANPQSASAYSALSYAEQGRFNLDKAQAAADHAVTLAPHDAMVWARKAELQLSQGLTEDSQQAAEKATALDANLERTQTVLGFSYLLRMETDSALETFNKAVQSDSTAPLARLGLGLAHIFHKPSKLPSR
jgi:tetratricopeptide (TPR) repeat protein